MAPKKYHVYCFSYSSLDNDWRTSIVTPTRKISNLIRATDAASYRCKAAFTRLGLADRETAGTFVDGQKARAEFVRGLKELLVQFGPLVRKYRSKSDAGIFVT